MQSASATDSFFASPFLTTFRRPLFVSLGRKNTTFFISRTFFRLLFLLFARCCWCALNFVVFFLYLFFFFLLLMCALAMAKELPLNSPASAM